MNRRQFLKLAGLATGTVLFPGIVVADTSLKSIKINSKTIRMFSVTYQGKFTEENLKMALFALIDNFKKVKRYKRYISFYPEVLPNITNQRRIKYKGYYFRYLEQYDISTKDLLQHFTMVVGLPS